MKNYEIREMNSKEISKRIVEEQNNLIDLRFQHAVKTLTNTSKIKLIRRDIAKMKSILRQRELSANSDRKSVV